MRLVFLGSGRFAVPSFEALLDAGHDVAAVVTQPDRRAGRGRGNAPPPVKPAAEARGVPVFQPQRIAAPDAVEALARLEPELGVVVAYGQLLPRTVLDVPPRGLVNVHASLLPAYRGAAPIQWAVVNGETHTGVTTMLLDEGLDTGPLLLARRTAIGADENAAELQERLAPLGAEILIETLEGLAGGTVLPQPQDHARASRAPLIRKEDGRIDWTRPAAELACRVRGFFPWPGSTTTLAGQHLKVLRAAVAAPGPGEPGLLVAFEHEGMVVACGGETRLRLIEVQPANRRPMPARAFASGARLVTGDRLR